MITRGSTVMGGANRLAEAFPDARIRAFAVMRVISNHNDFIDVDDPRVGLITMAGKDTRRIP